MPLVFKSGESIPQPDANQARMDEAISLGYTPPATIFSDEDLLMSMPTVQSPASIAQTAKAAYDRQFEEQRARQTQLPQVLGISPSESLARFGTQAYAGQVENVEPMQEMFGRMQAGGVIPPVGISGLLAGQIANYTNSKIFENLQRGGRPVYGDGQLQGVMLGGRYTGASEFDPVAARFARYDNDSQPEVVLPQYDPEANAKRCPDGYMFDEDLQACRLEGSIPSISEPAQARTLYQQPYQSTGLLDQDGFQYGVPLIYG